MAFDYTRDATAEAQRFLTAEHKRIHLLTVQDILNEDIATKLK